MLTRRHILVSLAGLGGALAPSPGQTIDRGTLFEVATRLVAIYRASDAEALHGMLSPELQPIFPPSALSLWLSDAQNAFGMLQRTSMPTYGSRTHGVFAAYFDRGPADMYLEINRQERLVLWAFKNDAKAMSIRKHG